MTPDLAPFKDLIKQRCGLLFEGNNETRLAQVLAERIDTLKTRPAEYCLRLQESEAEFQELVNLLTINETYFFREPEQISLLVERLAPRLLARRGDAAPLRILSAGCSSGEEPYSLAMVLREIHGDAVERLFDIHGGDIDSAVLAKARQGRYSEFSFRGLSPLRRERHFHRDGCHYILKQCIRSQVKFHEINLLSTGFPGVLQDLDIILFRNVSIYFDEATRRSIQHNLSALLKEDGILMTGTAETLANDFGLLSLVEEDGLFYFVKGASSAATAERPAQDWARPLHAELAPASDFSSPEIPVSDRAAPPGEARPLPATVTFDDLVSMAREHRYEKALPLLEQRLSFDACDSGALLLKAHILLDRKEFAAAENAAATVLEKDPWSVDALLLLGLAAKWREQTDTAIRHFKQAVYARQECWPAHYHLADLYYRAAARELARREYRVVLQLLAAQTPDTGLRVVPFDLSAGEIRFLCEHRLGKLDGHAGATATE